MGHTVGLLDGVANMVHCQGRVPCQLHLADGALGDLPHGMSPLVHKEVLVLAEGLATVLTCVRLLPSVCPLV